MKEKDYEERILKLEEAVQEQKEINQTLIKICALIYLTANLTESKLYNEMETRYHICG